WRSTEHIIKIVLIILGRPKRARRAERGGRGRPADYARLVQRLTGKKRILLSWCRCRNNLRHRLAGPRICDGSKWRLDSGWLLLWYRRLAGLRYRNLRKIWREWLFNGLGKRLSLQRIINRRRFPAGRGHLRCRSNHDPSAFN